MMRTTGTAMRSRLTRGQGRSDSGAGSEAGASVVSVSLMSLAPGAGTGTRNRTRPRERERVGSEEGLAHHGRLQDVGRRAAGDHGAPVHRHEAVGQLGDEGDVVLDDQHRGVELVADVAEQPDHRLDLALGHARRGLVEEDHGGLVRDDGGQVDEPPRAGRQLADEVVGVALEPEHLHELVDPAPDRRFGAHLYGQAEHRVEGVGDVGEPLE